ncbi:sarcolemmal membrane-associated protein [Drosophila subpulchrella]|uniref:sarcolemmal membrane-associated protein n=1 Tax=Drosophila subpulchrella TaxID=1486046 RepID=UPI0018A17846|nr:sarcolemmal membrane-associated protein [Drosophila subpulchrella]XP_037728717.1 sarcolemmal membrane-associated protein [Drosophila subpulchrella]
MVLVSNEWLTNNDDQKPSPSSPTTAPGAVGAIALSNITDIDTELPETTKPATGGGVASTIKRKKAQYAASMEAGKKFEQDQLFQIMDMNELIATGRNNEEAIENQENNNMQVCDSNTNTLQGVSNLDRRATAQMPTALSQQVLNLAMKSALNANNSGVGVEVTSVGSLLSSLGALNSSALQMEQAKDCGTLLVASVDPTAPVDSVKTLESATTSSTGGAKIVLQCEAKSHKFDTRSILLQPNKDCKVGRLIAKSKASDGNAIFDCKVLSRNHAMLWYTPDGRFWVKDTKSSNGTFINDNKLGNDPAELHSGDTVKFGVEVIENSRQEVHGCIIARVSLFLPDGREAISIDAGQMLLSGHNRISFDEIQRLNSFLQEAAQREKTLKAKLSSLQSVLDTTRKNSALCWQSMITEDQLLHKINLLEKKLQVMEKNVPENALRNEIVKLLEDKTAYQLTAKEALRKVYQERCDAIQMLSKMEMAFATSENECGILRAQVLTSKQTMQDFNARLEQLQQEYTEYKQESLRQQQEAKEQEDQNLELLKEKLTTQEHEVEKLRLQVTQLQQSIAEHDSEQLKEKDVLNHLNAILPNDDEYNNKGQGPEGKENQKSCIQNLLCAPQDHLIMDVDQHTAESATQKDKMKLSELDLEKIICNSSVIKLLRDSDLCKSEDGSAVLKAIFNDDDEDSECAIKEGYGKMQASNVGTDLVLSGFVTGIKREAAETVEEFVGKYSRDDRLNGINEMFEKSAAKSSSAHKLESQNTLVRVEESLYNQSDFPTEHAIEMLQEECHTYKRKTEHLTVENHSMREQIDLLRKQLEQEVTHDAKAKLQELRNEKRQDDSQNNTENDWKEDMAAMNNSQVDQEEELVVYKERLEHLERNNFELRKEISALHLNQQHIPPKKQVLLHRVLPLGCVAIALLIYLFSIRI